MRIGVDTVYRFLDKLSGELKEQVEQIGFEHPKRVLKGDLSLAFYDLTTLYPKLRFSRLATNNCPQINTNKHR